jgi:hypothetical protein
MRSVIARFGLVLYGCALAIASLCEIAAITGVADQHDKHYCRIGSLDSGGIFCSSRRIFVVGGRAAKYVLAGT